MKKHTLKLWLLLALALVGYCSQPQTRIAVPEIDAQRERISQAIGMIDGLDESATPAAVNYAQTVARTELISSDKTIFDLQQKLRVCAILQEDTVNAYTSCMDKKDKLESEGGFMARLGLRWSWFFYGVGSTLVLLIVGGIGLYFGGWMTRIAGMVGGIR